MANNNHVYPIYTTQGDIGAFLFYPYIFNPSGEWIGWVNQYRQVYSVYGHFVGYLSDEPRILRKRSYDEIPSWHKPPVKPAPIIPPTSLPLPPQMPELSLSQIDILDEEPERMPSLDTGELRQDLD